MSRLFFINPSLLAGFCRDNKTTILTHIQFMENMVNCEIEKYDENILSEFIENHKLVLNDEDCDWGSIWLINHQYFNLEINLHSKIIDGHVYYYVDQDCGYRFYLIDGRLQLKEYILEKDKLVFIPFDNQKSKFVSLIKLYSDKFYGVLNHYIDLDIATIAYGPETEFLNLPFVDSTQDWEGFELMCKTFNRKTFKPLPHLRVLEITKNNNGQVGVFCQYTGDKDLIYIPKSFKIVYTRDIKSLDELIECKGNGDERKLWYFTPLAFIAPCFGKHYE